MLESGIVLYRFNSFNALFLLLISNLRGWVLFCLTNKFYDSFFNIGLCFLGLLRCFSIGFKIKGFGFKFLRIKNGINIKVNFTHRILLFNPTNHKILYQSKTFFRIKARNIKLTRLALYYLFIFYKKVIYKKLGIYLKGTLFNLKLSKKKLKF